MTKKPVIAIAGLSCENSTFTPSRTTASSFHPKRSSSVLKQYPFLHPGTPLRNSATWLGILTGHALPGGIVTSTAFEELSNEIIDRLKTIISSTPLDGLWFEIHGAMYVSGMEDIEVELLRRIRAVIGPDVIVSASMDLHGNVSRELAHGCDLITCYRTAPHEDVVETQERACKNLVNLLMKRKEDGMEEKLQLHLPLKAWIPIPILLPGEQTSTRIEPAKHIYAAIPSVEATEGIIDAAIWVGYAWADEPRNRAIVMVTGWSEAIIRHYSEKLANLFWDARTSFEFVAPTGSFSECLEAGLKSKERPYFISDSGDNPTAGGSGDVTWGLTRLLERPEFKSDDGPKVIYASLPGPKAIDVAVKAGVDAIVTVTAGAEVDDIHAGPLTMTGRVHSIKHGDQHAEVEAVIQVGSVYAILTKLRKPYHKERDFTDLNLDPRKGADIVIVKIGYLEPELYDMAKDWMMALTPGGVDQDLERLGHRRIRRPMWPMDKEFEKKPDLRARIIPSSRVELEGPNE